MSREERELLDWETLDAAAESHEYEHGVLAGQEVRAAISRIRATVEHLRRDLRYLAEGGTDAS